MSSAIPGSCAPWTSLLTEYISQVYRLETKAILAWNIQSAAAFNC